MRARLLLLLLLTLALPAACGDDSGGSGTDSGGTVDADGDTNPHAPDAGTSDSSVPDAADVPHLADTSPDTSPDTAPDAAPDTAPDAAPDAGPPWPPLTPEFCGAPPYEWLPPSAVGAPLVFRELELIHRFPAAALDTLLQQAGYGGITPVSCGVTVYRLRYTTQDHGVVREATAAVGLPTAECAAAGESLPLALWMHHSVGFVDDCAPSRDALFAAVAPAVLASRGWLTVAPDLLGLMGFGDPSPPGAVHPYLVAEPTALAGLDSVRATLAALAEHADLPQGDPARLLVAGGSQGGHAAWFVDRYAAHYAPELTILAVATIVPPTDLGALVSHAVQEWGPAARVVPTFLETLRAWYGAPADLRGVLTDTDPHHLATDVQAIMAGDCRFELRLDGVDGLDDLFEADFMTTAAEGDWSALPPWDCYFRENSVATSAVPRLTDAPVLAVFAENDELIDTATERADVARLCAQGYVLDVTVCAGLPHTEGGRAAMGLLLDWLERRLAGEPIPEERRCVIADPVDCESLP